MFVKERGAGGGGGGCGEGGSKTCEMTFPRGARRESRRLFALERVPR